MKRTLFAVAVAAVSQGALSGTYSRTNPFTGSVQDFTHVFVGSTDLTWDAVTNWRTVDGDSLVTYSPSSAPHMSGSDVWAPVLLDGELISGDSKAVTLTQMEGWAPKVAVMNGATVTVSNLVKLQGGGWFWVGANSKLTFSAFGNGNTQAGSYQYYVQSPDGIEWSCGFNGDKTIEYYLDANGTVRYAAGVSAGTHKIMRAGFTLAPQGSTAPRVGILYKKLIGFSGEFSPDCTFGSGAKVNGQDADPAEELVASEANVGKYKLEKKDDGIYIAYVDRVYGVANPVTGDMIDPNYVYVGTDGNWEAVANWRQPSNGSLAAYSGHATLAPLIKNSNAYGIGLIDGGLIEADDKSVTNGTAKVEGWNFRLAVVNGAKVTINSQDKFQGNGMYLAVDDTSKVTFAQAFSGSSVGTVGFYVAAEDGITFTPDWSRNDTYNYNLTGDGSVKFGRLLGGTHTVSRADFALSDPAGKDHRTVVKKPLITFTECTPAIGSANATVVAKGADGAAVTVSRNDLLTTADPVGTYTFVKESDGFYLAYVDYSATAGEELYPTIYLNGGNGGTVDLSVAANWRGSTKPGANGIANFVLSADTAVSVGEAMSLSEMRVSGTGKLTITDGSAVLTVGKLFANAEVVTRHGVVVVTNVAIGENAAFDYTVNGDAQTIASVSGKGKLTLRGNTTVSVTSYTQCGEVVIDNGMTLALAKDGTVIYGVSGAGTLTWNGTGTLKMWKANADSTAYTVKNAKVVINSGTVALGWQETDRDGSYLENATLEFNGGNVSAYGWISGKTGTTMTFDMKQDGTITGNANNKTQNSGVVKKGSGMLTYKSILDTSVTATVEEGVLKVVSDWLPLGKVVLYKPASLVTPLSAAIGEVSGPDNTYRVITTDGTDTTTYTVKAKGFTIVVM